MKIALCISGNLRNYIACANNIFFKALSNSCDIYVSVWDTVYPRSSCNNGMLAIPIADVDINTLKDVYRTDNVKVHAPIDFSNPLHDTFELRNFGKVSDYKSMHYLIKDSIEFALNSNNYDLIIRTRPDLWMLSDVDIQSMKLTFPYCARINNEPGCTDIFFRGTPDDMTRIISFGDNINKYLPLHVSNWHEAFFTNYIKSSNIAFDMDLHQRFQLLRDDMSQCTIGFYDEDGKLIDIPKIKI